MTLRDLNIDLGKKLPKYNWKPLRALERFFPAFLSFLVFELCVVVILTPPPFPWSWRWPLPTRAQVKRPNSGKIQTRALTTPIHRSLRNSQQLFKMIGCTKCTSRFLYLLPKGRSNLWPSHYQSVGENSSVQWPLEITWRHCKYQQFLAITFDWNEMQALSQIHGVCLVKTNRLITTRPVWVRPWP